MNRDPIGIFQYAPLRDARRGRHGFDRPVVKCTAKMHVHSQETGYVPSTVAQQYLFGYIVYTTLKFDRMSLIIPHSISPFIGDNLKQNKNNNGVTVAMLRAFVCMSRNLNLSKTSSEMGATRQTVRRHITDLEAILGNDLFEVTERQYHLTDFAKSNIDEAKHLMVQFDAWSGQSSLNKTSVGGLEKLKYTDTSGRVFHSHQHPVSQIALKGLPVMKKAFAAWGNAQTQIEHPAMDEIRQYMVLFRKGPAGWVFVHVGKESAYARWFGWAWSRSAIGKLISEDNAGDEYNEFSLGAYSRIYDEGGVRLDHIFAHLPREDGEPQPGTFQRLLLGGVFPDGTPGLILLAAITEQVEIDGLAQADQPQLSSDLVMDAVA
jgi:hypothetical protein